jgi:superfamily II DNA or RNA helicase
MTEKDKLQQEGFRLAEKAKFNGIFLLPTGTGKGKLMIDIVKHLKPKSILYLCDTTLLRDKMIVDEFRAWDAEQYLQVMDRVCYQTACKWKDKHYELILADEFDAALTPTRKNTFNNIKSDYRIMVSATLDDKKRTMAKRIAPILFEQTPKEVIERGILNNVQYYYVNYDLTTAENIKYLEYNKSFRNLLQGIQTGDVTRKLEMLQIQRKQFLSSLGSSVKVVKWIRHNLEQRKQKILIFCGLSEQAQKVCEHSYFADSDDQTMLTKFELGHILTLAVVNKVDRGVNISGIKHIIHESVGRSKTRLTQRNGRGMRLSTDDTLNVFFLVPHYQHQYQGRQPTIVKKWIQDSAVDMDLTNAKDINYVQN